MWHLAVKDDGCTADCLLKASAKSCSALPVGCAAPAELLTHAYTAGKYAAEANDAQIVDPREYYQGSLKRTLKKYPHIGKTIPAMGYSPKQARRLLSSLLSYRSCPCLTCR